MALKFNIDRSPSDVQAAMLQFAARRSYRLFTPWWIDGQRVEIPPPPESDRATRARMPLLGRLFAGLRTGLDLDGRPRVDVELKTRKNKTLVSMNLNSHERSVQLAHDLRSFLSEPRAYESECPALCPRCSAAVSNMSARYCGRCGLQFAEAKQRTPANEIVNWARRLAAKPNLSVQPVAERYEPLEQSAAEPGDPNDRWRDTALSDPAAADQAQEAPYAPAESAEQAAADNAVGPMDDAEPERRIPDLVEPEDEPAEDNSVASVETAENPKEDDSTELLDVPAPRRRAIAED